MTRRGDPSWIADVQHQVRELQRYATEEPAAPRADLVRALLRLERTVAKLHEAEAALAERARLAELGAEVGAELIRGEALGDKLGRCAGALVAHLDAAFAGIWALDAAANVLTLEACAGKTSDSIRAHIPVGKTGIGAIAAERRSYLTNRVADDPAVDHPEWIRRERIVSFAGYPLLVEGTLVGVMAVYGRRRLDDAALRAMASVADQIGLGIRRRQVETELHELNRDLERRILERTRELSENQERFRRVFDASPDAMALNAFPEGHYLEVNEEFLRLGRFRREEVIGKTPAALGVWMDPEALRCMVGELRSRGLVRNFSADFRMRDGTIVSGLYSAVLTDVSGKQYIISFLRDVTERNRAAERLREQEEHFRALIEQGSDYILVVGSDAIIRYASPSLERDFGFPGDEVVGRSGFDFAHPDDVGKLRDLFRAILSDPGRPKTARYRARCKDGSWRLLESVGTNQLYHPAVGGIIINSRDVSEREGAERRLRESEAQLAEAQRIARLGSFDWDPAADRATWSEALYEICGVEPGSFTPGLATFLPLVHPDDRRRFREAIEGGFSRGEPINVEYRLVRPDGEVRILQARGRPITDESGRPVRLIGTSQDVTERKRAEEEVQRALARARESDRLKSAFLANMSHEVRTPLNVILGYSSLVAEHLEMKGDDSQNELLDGIHRAGKRLIQTLHHVLDYSKIETGSFAWNAIEIGIVTVIEPLIDEYRALAERKGLAFSFENAARDATVVCDTECLAGALRNLLDNAVKFTSEGRVSVKLVGDRATGLRLEVRDTGVGIDPGYFARLFEPFSQEQSGYTRDYEGTGLGLAVARKYLELNGAWIAVESEKGEGSTFTIHFPPSSPSARIGADDGRETKRPSDRAAGAGERPLVLVVEDDPETQIYMQALLGRTYEVLIAAGGTEVRRHLRERAGEIAVVLMDLSLKGKEDGLQLTRAIRADGRWRHVPIIATTAHASIEDKEKALAAGCDAYLAKPFAQQELVGMMERLLSASAAGHRSS